MEKDLFKHFGFQSGRDVDKFADYPKENYQQAENGIPYIVAGTNVYLSQCPSLLPSGTLTLAGTTLLQHN